MESVKRDCVRELLIITHLSENWLRHILNTYYDLKIEKAEFTRILNGSLQTNKSEKVLTASIKVLDSYGKWEETLNK